ncbi:MAG: hypothetical protein U9P79_00145 [Candidatus Cloacimonadota bacterium]|nr:hypothetical protein [Candidatus Cloacimonadota bacterium]
MKIYISDRCGLSCFLFLLVLISVFQSFFGTEIFAEDNGEKVILKVFQLPDPKATDAFSKADRAIMKTFRVKYPNIELRSFSEGN